MTQAACAATIVNRFRQSGGTVHQPYTMSVTKEVEALVIASLSRMKDSQFRKVLKASLDGRRYGSDAAAPKKPKRQKLHWKTIEKMKREQKERQKKKSKPGVSPAHNA